ncbi:MAG: 1-(5-phosphoribosyl)-5-[(5-phosphoribosylamino)methylideneamino]imidazole-4-carboxamide isomerase [Actinobacteria bacterium]|jgi:phosphoribosylformimino-5-aminoimidazole carboxamide ribotide isomerase|nr:1-(5-phosphoribosyl)-5-[(5-phosphoribosylamino)methylideneamino]imidazole-4-carboxamide isomerase [Actinomycetota bacterium]
MRLIPAIDIQGGHCVRLRKGDFADVTVFGDDPVAMAEHWVSEGARFLHVVDLDGAREGKPRNFELVRAIAEAVPVPVETGGGIRTEEALQLVASSRVAKAVLGTSAVEDEAFLERALAVLGSDRLVVAVDAEEGFVKTKGWQERSEVRTLDLAARLEDRGVREILFTDISRDGMMQSVNLDGIRELAEYCDLEIIASGGVTGLEDLVALRSMERLGVTGVIAGRALYEGRFTVAEALAVLDAPEED